MQSCQCITVLHDSQIVSILNRNTNCFNHKLKKFNSTFVYNFKVSKYLHLIRNSTNNYNWNVDNVVTLDFFFNFACFCWPNSVKFSRLESRYQFHPHWSRKLDRCRMHHRYFLEWDCEWKLGKRFRHLSKTAESLSCPEYKITMVKTKMESSSGFTWLRSSQCAQRSWALTRVLFESVHTNTGVLWRSRSLVWRNNRFCVKLCYWYVSFSFFFRSIKIWLFILLGRKDEISKRKPWPETKKINDYCCSQHLNQVSLLSFNVKIILNTLDFLYLIPCE